MPLREPFVYEGGQYEELIGAQEGLRAVMFLIQNSNGMYVCMYVVEGDRYRLLIVSRHGYECESK